MPITDDIRKTLTDPTPLYFAAGIIDKIREEAPERIAAVRATDPKEVQAKLAEQAKETQAKVSDALVTVDTDIKKLRGQAQHLALQGVGTAAEYAVKAREAYGEFADRGRGAVKTWRGEEDDGSAQVTVERETVKVAQPPVSGTQKQSPASTTASAADSTTTSAADSAGNGQDSKPESGS